MSKEVKLQVNETLDDLLLGGLKVIQPKIGYRFSLDAVLLAHFCQLNKVNEIVDLGTGNGIIPLLLTYLSPTAKITGIEIQAQMVERARRSAEINHLTARVEFINQDIKELKTEYTGGYADLVVCNPPFYKKGEGKISQNSEEAIARHEVAVSMPHIISGAKHLLSDRGKVVLIQRAERLFEITDLLIANSINPTRMRLVHSRIDSDAKLVLIEGQKNSQTKLKILSPLIIYQSDGEYSGEIMGWYGLKLN